MKDRIDAIPLALMIVNHHNQIVDINLAAEDALLHGRDYICGRDIAYFWGEDSSLISAVEEVRVADVPIQIHDLAPAHPALDSYRHSATISKGIKDGEVLLCLLPSGVQRKLAAGRLRQNQARGLSAFARMLTHEVKNPLAGIRLRSESVQAV